MASDGAFTGPADEGSALPNTERLRDCSSQKEGQSRGPSVRPPLFWRGPEGAQLLLIQSFPVLEVVLQVPHKVRQVNKGCREKRDAGSSQPFFIKGSASSLSLGMELGRTPTLAQCFKRD